MSEVVGPVILEPAVLAAFVAVAAAAGVAAGIGGAVLVVAVLVALGVDTPTAAGFGLLTVVTASTAAAPGQLRQGLANHRLAVVLECGAATGAAVGAALLAIVPLGVFRAVLIGAVVLAAAAAFARRGQRNLPDPRLGPDDAGEHRGALSGAYRLGDSVVPYRARRVPAGVAASVGIGVVAGLTGTSGGYLKTPLMSEVLHVPVKVAAATTTYASGLTAIAGLSVLLTRGAVPAGLGAAVVLGGLVGGWAGAALQERLSPRPSRMLLAVLLIAIVVVLLWDG